MYDLQSKDKTICMDKLMGLAIISIWQLNKESCFVCRHNCSEDIQPANFECSWCILF